jgi:hypothetical protein
VPASFAPTLGLAIVTTLIVAGLAWHECVLIAAAAAVGHRLFLRQMDAGAPSAAWRMGVRCLSAGLVRMLAALALLGLVVAGFTDMWAMAHNHGDAVLASLVLTATILVGIQVDARGRWVEARFWTVTAAAAAFTFAGPRYGAAVLPCLFTVGVAFWLGHRSWTLARDEAGAMFRAEQRM